MDESLDHFGLVQIYTAHVQSYGLCDFRADQSMYHALSYGTIMYIQAVMTFDMVSALFYCTLKENGADKDMGIV